MNKSIRKCFALCALALCGHSAEAGSHSLKELDTKYKKAVTPAENLDIAKHLQKLTDTYSADTYSVDTLQKKVEKLDDEARNILQQRLSSLVYKPDAERKMHEHDIIEAFLADDDAKEAEILEAQTLKKRAYEDELIQRIRQATQRSLNELLPFLTSGVLASIPSMLGASPQKEALDMFLKDLQKGAHNNRCDEIAIVLNSFPSSSTTRDTDTLSLVGMLTNSQGGNRSYEEMRGLVDAFLNTQEKRQKIAHFFAVSENEKDKQRIRDIFHLSAEERFQKLRATILAHLTVPEADNSSGEGALRDLLQYLLDSLDLLQLAKRENELHLNRTKTREEKADICFEGFVPNPRSIGDVLNAALTYILTHRQTHIEETVRNMESSCVQEELKHPSLSPKMKELFEVSH